MTDTPIPTTLQIQAALGCMIGAAVGDALGGPFEFGEAGEYSSRFPQPVLGGVGEMVGGGGFGWARAEFTDDTQLALALAEALLARDGEFDADTVWTHFRGWARSARDIGLTTAASLSRSDHRGASRLAHELLGASGSNGSVMRIAPVGIVGVRWGEAETTRVAFAQAALTHHDELACWGSVLVAAMLRRLILGADIEGAIEGSIVALPHPAAEIYRRLLAPGWTPAEERSAGNGAATICVAQAVWAVRGSTDFADAVVRAVDLGGDTDTVAAVAGAIAGATYGIQRIPSRWTTYLHGSVEQPDGRVRRYEAHDLQRIAHALLGTVERPIVDPEPAYGPSTLDHGAPQAANLAGAARASHDTAVVTLCRGVGLFDRHPHRREVYLIDAPDDENPWLYSAVDDAVLSIDAFLAEGRDVVVHCHGGRSRTGLVLKAWYMRHHGVDHAQAHRWLRDRWPLYSTWNERFADFLVTEWEAR